MAEVFAYRDSVSVEAEADIRRIMRRIKKTLAANRKAINSLKPEWTAVEADGYYKALAGVRKGTGELKEAIGEALDSVE